MSKIVIQVENLGKKYLIRHQSTERYTALRDVIVQRAFVIGKKVLHPKGSRRSNRTREEFWALKDISFEVKRGEVIGIIGRNGAGKSTLLKILSRITEPTMGRIRIKGRVGSLLEVGTGFHPELTGRENIYLNGAVLGMTRSEITARFDEIVGFSGIEQFLDTPVKRYSSGMYVRLAFSVAAHLEPEILLVDEVLAVGDMGFQQKCLGKMGEATREGRTVLFVSHNLAAIANLCSSAIHLQEGRIVFQGETHETIESYTRPFLGPVRDDAVLKINEQNFIGASEQRIVDLHLLDISGEKLTCLRTGDSVCFRLFFEMDKPLSNPGFRIVFFSEARTELLRLSTDPISGYHVPAMSQGKGHIDCIFKSFPLTAGMYLIDLAFMRAKHGSIHSVDNAASLRVDAGDPYGSGMHLTNRSGFFTCEHEWRLEAV